MKKLKLNSIEFWENWNWYKFATAFKFIYRFWNYFILIFITKLQCEIASGIILNFAVLSIYLLENAKSFEASQPEMVTVEKVQFLCIRVHSTCFRLVKRALNNFIIEELMLYQRGVSPLCHWVTLVSFTEDLKKRLKSLFRSVFLSLFIFYISHR